MARELDGTPDLLVARLFDDPVELSLQARELARQAGSAQQRDRPQPAKPVAEVKLRLTRHSRTGGRDGRGTASARAGARSRPGGRIGSWTRRARNRRAASPASSAGRP